MKNFTPAEAVRLLHSEIDRTNLYDRCDYNQEYRKLFRTIAQKLFKEYGVQYNWKTKIVRDDTKHPKFRRFTPLEILEMGIKQLNDVQKETSLATSGMEDALEELKWSLGLQKQ